MTTKTLKRPQLFFRPMRRSGETTFEARLGPHVCRVEYLPNNWWSFVFLPDGFEGYLLSTTKF